MSRSPVFSPLGAAIGAVGLLALSSSPAWAMATDARALAMGNAYSAIANGADRAAWNPALMGLHTPDDHWVQMTLPSVSLGAGNNFLSLSSILGLLPDSSGNPATLNQSAVQNLLGTLPSSGWQLSVDSGVRAALASPVLGTSVLAETDLDVEGLGIPHDLVQLLLEGNTNTPNVDISSLKGATATAVGSVGLSQAIPLPKIFGTQSAIGVTVRYLQGLGYATVTNASGSLISSNSKTGQISSNASLEYESTYPTNLSNLLSTGSGVAVDLGFANQLTRQVRWDLMVGNLGYLKWNNIQDKTVSLNQSPTGAGLSATGNSTTPNFSSDMQSTAGANNGKSGMDGHLPPYARFGIGWQGALGLGWYKMPTAVDLDLQQGFGEGYGISDKPELRLGAELCPLGGWLPLRIGTTIGGDLPMTGLGFGINLDRVKIDVAAGTMFGYLDNSSKGFYGTVTTTFAI